MWTVRISPTSGMISCPEHTQSRLVHVTLRAAVLLWLKQRPSPSGNRPHRRLLNCGVKRDASSGLGLSLRIVPQLSGGLWMIVACQEILFVWTVRISPTSGMISCPEHTQSRLVHVTLRAAVLLWLKTAFAGPAESVPAPDLP